MPNKPVLIHASEAARLPWGSLLNPGDWFTVNPTESNHMPQTLIRIVRNYAKRRGYKISVRAANDAGIPCLLVELLP